MLSKGEEKTLGHDLPDRPRYGECAVILTVASMGVNCLPHLHIERGGQAAREK